MFFDQHYPGWIFDQSYLFPVHPKQQLQPQQQQPIPPKRSYKRNWTKEISPVREEIKYQNTTTRIIQECLTIASNKEDEEFYQVNKNRLRGYWLNQQYRHHHYQQQQHLKCYPSPLTSFVSSLPNCIPQSLFDLDRWIQQYKTDEMLLYYEFFDLSKQNSDILFDLLQHRIHTKITPIWYSSFERVLTRLKIAHFIRATHNTKYNIIIHLIDKSEQIVERDDCIGLKRLKKTKTCNCQPGILICETTGKLHDIPHHNMIRPGSLSELFQVTFTNYKVPATISVHLVSSFSKRNAYKMAYLPSGRTKCNCDYCEGIYEYLIPKEKSIQGETTQQRRQQKQHHQQEEKAKEKHYLLPSTRLLVETIKNEFPFPLADDTFSSLIDVNNQLDLSLGEKPSFYSSDFDSILSEGETEITKESITDIIDDSLSDNTSDNTSDDNHHIFSSLFVF